MSNWLPDLAGHSGPRYRTIVAALQADIAAGRLHPGCRLPPHRDLAWRLKVTVGTIARAYAEAERLGLVSGEVGRGTFVRDPRSGDPSVAALFKAHDLADGRIDMAFNRPSGDCNAAQIAAALQSVAVMPGLPAILSYNLEGISPRYRATGAVWLKHLGLEVPPDRLILTAGGQQGIVAALAAVTRPGDRVFCEEFTYPGLKSAAALLGRQLVPLRLDDGGLCPRALERALQSGEGRVVYTIPSSQNPTTTTQSEERRRTIADLARRYDAILVEDAIYAFLDAALPPPLAALAPERTLHVTSLAKSVAPALRIGWVAAPEGFVGRIAGGVGATTLMPPAIMAEAAAVLVENGTAARCAEAQRSEALARRALAAEILGAARALSPASLNIWLPLPEGAAADGFVAEARRNGVALTPGTSFAVDRPRYEAVRVSISAARDRSELERGLRIVAGMLRVTPENVCTTV